MVTVCLICGGTGFELALDKCHKCQDCALHRYCRKVLPKDLSEEMIWYCEDCEPEVANQCADSGSSRSGFVASGEPDEVQSDKSLPKFKNRSISCTTHESEMEDDLSEGSPHCNDKNLKRRRVLVSEEEKSDEDRHLDASEDNLRPLKNSSGFCLKETSISSSQAKIKDDELLCQEKCGNDIKLGSGRLVLEDDEINSNNNNRKCRKQRRLILEDEEEPPLENSLGPGNDTKPLDVVEQKHGASSEGNATVQLRKSKCSDVDPRHREKWGTDAKLGEQRRLVLGEEEEKEEAQPLVTSRLPVGHFETSNVSEQVFCDPLPMKDPVWTGSLRIANEDSNTVKRLLAAAHLSTLANSKASDTAKVFPGLIFLQMFSRSQLWPECFWDLGPSSHHIALYFFPDSRDELFIDKLIDKMHGRDLALRAVYERTELLIFPSNVLPIKCRTVRSKYFLWGVFRSKRDSSPANM